MLSLIALAKAQREALSALSQAAWELLCNSHKTPSVESLRDSIQQFHTLTTLQTAAIDPQLIDNLIAESIHFEKRFSRNNADRQRRHDKGANPNSPTAPKTLLRSARDYRSKYLPEPQAPIAAIAGAKPQDFSTFGQSPSDLAEIEAIRLACEGYFLTGEIPPGTSPDNAILARGALKRHRTVARERVALGTASPAEIIALDFWSQQDRAQSAQGESDDIF
jgi:hypothetical protein